MKLTLFTSLRAGLVALFASALLAGGAYAESSDLFELTFDDLQGEPQAMASYQGKPLVVNFWATWCPPCIKEMPDLESLSQQHPEVQFVGLAIDTKRNVKKFLEKIPVSYDLYVPGHGGVKHMRELGNPKGGLPFTLVIDAQGTVQHRLLGQIEKPQLHQMLEDLKIKPVDVSSL